MSKSHSGKDHSRIDLPSRVVLGDCQPLKVDLADLLGLGKPLVVDVSAVEDIDFAGVQLLACARKTAQAAGNTLTIVSSSSGVVGAALARAGFRDFEVVSV